MSLSLQEHIRKSREAVAANRAKGNRHAELFARLYSDPYRFLDEILQNTEDAYARKATDDGMCTLQFRFTDTGLDILHNGIDFDEADLKAITTFAGTTKNRENGINQIGKFGIGFRSVYALTDHPEIHCGFWHFRIDDYEVLEEIASVEPPAGFSTLIRLPFRESDARQIKKWVREGLDRLSAYSILFLKYLSVVEVYVHGKLHRSIRAQRNPLSETVNNIAILDKTRIEKISEYLLLCHNSEQQGDTCAIAFRLSRDDQGKTKIVQEDHPYLFVYFPTRQESHLKFLVHARFTTTPTREAIPFDREKTPENLQLLAHVASLLSRSMVSLRNLGFVDASFFKVLPLSPAEGKSVDQEVYEAFHKEIKRILQSRKMIPVQSGNHGLAQEIMFTSDPSIMELIDTSALQLFYQHSLWLHSDFQALPAVAKSLTALCEIKEVDCTSVAFRISVQPDFLSQKPVKWHQLFYTFLAAHPELWDGLHKHEYYSLRYQPLIRLKSGVNTSAFDRSDRPLVFFPSGKRTTPNDIHPALLKDGASMNFLKMLGVSYEIKELSLAEEPGWSCETGAQSVASEIDLRSIKPEKPEITAMDKVSLISGMQSLGELLRFSDPFREMLQWSVECARILLMKKFPGALCSETTADAAQIKLTVSGAEQTVYVACRASLQHRYLMPAADWAAMYFDRSESSKLVLISEAGTLNASALILENPGAVMQKGHFSSDPIAFNLLDL